MNALRVGIIEDESTAAERLKEMLLRLNPNIVVMGIVQSIAEARIWLRDHTPDVLFMDVELADGRCFILFDEGTVNCPVIFTTAYDQFAIKAFRVKALDYLLKPIKEEELAGALARVRDQSSPGLDAIKAIRELLNVPVRSDVKQRFMVRLGTKINVLESEEIAYAFTEAKSTLFMTFTGKRFPADQSLEELEHQLDPAIFFRVNRQYILNIKAIQEMHVHSKSRLKIITSPPTQDSIIVSSERSAGFKHWLDKGG